MELMKNKKGVIMGLANDKSIAWGIAKQLSDNGAEIALTYQGEALLKRIMPLAEKINVPESRIVECNVTEESSIETAFDKIKEEMGDIDFVVHAIGFSDKNELSGKYYDTTKENFLNTMNISCFSFTSVCKKASTMMNDGGSLVTLTYLGANVYVPNYNVMGVAKAALEASVRYLAVDLGDRGIRVNSVSAGPIKTLAAMGISDFKTMLKWNELISVIPNNVSIEQVGGSTLYLLSDLSTGVTGENHFVDNGNNKVAMPPVNRFDKLCDMFIDIKESRK